MNREYRRSSKLPEDFDTLLAEAIQLKREVPTRSVNQIIYILEGEGRVKPGTLKRSTVQRYLYRAGFGKKQMKKYAEGKYSSSKRFCKPHRMMLVQGDIKYGIMLPIGPNAKKIMTYGRHSLDCVPGVGRCVFDGIYCAAHSGLDCTDRTAHSGLDCTDRTAHGGLDCTDRIAQPAVTARVGSVQRVVANVAVKIERARHDDIAEIGILRDKGTDLAVVIPRSEVLQSCRVIHSLGVVAIGIVAGGSGCEIAVRIVAVAYLRRTHVGEQRGYVSSAVIGVVGRFTELLGDK